MQGLTWEGWGKVVLRAPSFHREEFEEAVWLGVADLALNPDPGCVTLSRSLDGDTFPVPRVLYRFDETVYVFSRCVWQACNALGLCQRARQFAFYLGVGKETLGSGRQ